MTVELNHTIVPSRDQRAAAEDLADLLGLEVTKAHFDAVHLGNGVSLDFMDVDEVPRQPMHLAFLVSEETFDEVFARVQEREQPYWAGPMHNSRRSSVRTTAAAASTRTAARTATPTRC